MDNEIYLDNSATTRPFDEVIDLMSLIYKEHYGNPSSLHRKGIDAERLIKEARDRIAKTLGAQNKEIIFTSGGTEASNMAIIGYLEANPRAGKHIVTSQIEHPATLEVFKYLKTKGYELDILKVDRDGKILLEDMEQVIRENTALLSFMLVNNEVGTIQPVEEIIKVIKGKNKNTTVHVDAVQGYGKLKIVPSKMGIDMLSISSHKIHGPKGIGALYLSNKTKIKPIIMGGGQEQLLRSGTENVAGIAGFGLAAEIVNEKLSENYVKVLELRNHFLAEIEVNLPDSRIISPIDSLPYILNVSFGKLKSEVLLHHLEEKHIYVSAGSACSSRKNVHSHVLVSMGVKPADIDSAIRFSFNASNRVEEIDEVVNALKEIVPRIQYRR